MGYESRFYDPEDAEWASGEDCETDEDGDGLLEELETDDDGHIKRPGRKTGGEDAVLTEDEP